MTFLVTKREGYLDFRNCWTNVGFVKAEHITEAAVQLGFNLDPELVRELPGHAGHETFFHHRGSNTDYEIASLALITRPLV